ncbi:MAG: sigma-54-dependent Fis family transcriptional regulator [Deltaproteobacteria bacterium]|nr:MAG: sigma-54-dependent Fis family transcriptional regulator [Deltaproteobacteria bacterium]
MEEERLRRALREASSALIRRIEELSFVRLVGDALTGEVERAGVGRALVGLLRDELGLEFAGLWTVDDVAGGLRATAWVRAEDRSPACPSPDAPLVPFSSGPIGAAVGGTPVLVSDAAAEPALPREATGVGSLFCFPVVARGRTIAVIGLGAAGPEGIDAEHERLVGLVAPAVALALESAVFVQRLASENRSLRAELTDRYGLIGTSRAFRQLLATVARLAEVDATVLVLGASGTGKEMVARALHHGGRRRDAPFVAVNCAALPEALLESELFGIERGVATGVERRTGVIERASGGTLLLDEIGDMSPVVQAKLLRVLQEREVTRVGGARPIPLDVRVVAATHRDLERAVRDGSFREDLYFRLKVATIRVPTLAERSEDVPLLAHHFLARAAARHGRAGLRLSPEAVAALAARPWPGNVRELENVIEQAAVMTEGAIIGPAEVGESATVRSRSELDYRGAVGAAVDQTERALIARALAASGQNRTRAARLLGIGRRTLLYKLKRYGLAEP